MTVGECYRFYEFELDASRRELAANGAPCAMEPKAFDLLHYLIRHSERVVEKAELRREVWKGEVVSAGVLSQCVWAIRRALGDDGTHQRIIKTVHGRGYRFVAAHSVRSEAPRSRMQLTEVAGDRADPFVGRARELSLLEEALTAAAGGAGRLCLLSGDAGIGKTRLAEEVVAVARRTGVAVHAARCLEDEGGGAYRPWAQVVRGYVAGRSPQTMLLALGPGVADIVEVVPELEALVGPVARPAVLTPHHARFRFFDSFARFLRSAAADEPLVVWLDDLHDADEPSLALLEFLTVHLPDTRVLVLGTHRDGEGWLSSERGAALERLARASCTRVFRLGGLAPEGVAAVIESVSGERPNAAVVSAIHASTKGNPLFVQETVRVVLQESGRLEAAMSDAEWAPLPSRVADATARRLERLSPECAALLDCAAAIGREFKLSTLGQASGRSQEAALASLEEAADAGLVIEQRPAPAEFRFGHALTREAVYRRIKPARRMQLHRDVGLALERLDPERAQLDELAYHFLRAAPLGYERHAIDYSCAAGARATARMAHEEAAGHYARALEVSTCVRERMEIRILLGVAQIRGGKVAEGQANMMDAAAKAKDAGAGEALAGAAIELAPPFFGVGTGATDPFVVALLEAGLDCVGPGDSARRARLLAELAMARHWSLPVESRDEMTREACAVAERVGHPETRMYVASRRQCALWAPDDLDGQLELSRRVIHSADALADRETSLVHRFLRITTLIDKGDTASADAETTAFLALATKVREPQSLWYAERYAALRALMSGRFDEAERRAATYLEIGGRLEPENAQHSFGAQLVALRWHQGRMEEVRAILEPFVRGLDVLQAWAAAFAFLLADHGALDVAREAFEPIARAGFTGIQRNGHYLLAATALADTSAILGDRERGRQLYDLLTPYADHHVNTFAVIYRGTVRRSLGILARMLGQPDVAALHLERATAAEARIGARPWEALSALELARALADLGAGARPRALLAARRCVALARTLGMSTVDARGSALQAELSSDAVRERLPEEFLSEA